MLYSTYMNTLTKELLGTLRSIGIALAIVFFIRIFIFQPFLVSGESMYPTFNNGDYLIVDEVSYRLKEPQRGDVVIFKYPENPKRFFIKRIIGLPGETIIFKNNEVYIQTNSSADMIKLSEPYINQITIPINTTEQKIDPDNYFVMGDNRGFSLDSRAWGQLPKENIVGIAGLRLFPLSAIEYRPGALSHFENKE